MEGYEDETSTVDDYPTGYGQRSQSPAHASGGFYNPPPPGSSAAGQSSGFTHHPNMATTNLAQSYYQAPYNPQDYPSFPQAPPGPPPNTTAPGGIPSPIHPNDPEHVSEASVGRSIPETEAAGRPTNDLKKGASGSSIFLSPSRQPLSPIAG